MKENGNQGIGFVGLLTIVFITLKLIGQINWAWLWVLSPIWIKVVLIILLLIVYLISATIAFAIAYKRREEGRK